MWRLIRWFVVLIVLGAGGWSLWWYAGARGQEAGIEAWLDAQRKRGWVAEAGIVEVEGYPLEFRLRATDLNFSDPRFGWFWAAPELRAKSLSYEPTRIVVTWPGRQNVIVPGDQIEIRSEGAGTTLDLRPGTDMELRQAATDVTKLRITGTRGWSAGAKSVSIDVSERSEGDAPANSYALTAEAADLILPKAIIERIDPTGWLRPRIDRFTIKANGAFEEALSRRTMESGRSVLTQATIREAGFEWGDMRLVVSGSFTVNAQGYPEGEIFVEAHEWRQMVRLTTRAGLIDQGTGNAVIKAIEFVNALAGGREELRAPLTLKGGKIRLGPFAVADAPRLEPPGR